jgi:hypothetical protein
MAKLVGLRGRMSDTGRTVDQVRAAIQAFREQIAHIDSLIPQGSYLVRGAGEQAREAAKNLKASITAEHKRPASSRRSMSRVELDLFDPCMHRVFVALQFLKVGSSPGPEWRTALFNADSELSHYLYLLDQ